MSESSLDITESLDQSIDSSATIIIFDGVCGLCNSFVMFVLKCDYKGEFRFVSAQSEVGKQLQNQHQIDVIESDTVIVIKKNRAFTQSDAVIAVAAQLFSPVLGALRIVPRVIRDNVYMLVARNRYRLFGQHCALIPPELRSRFLDLG